MMPLKEHIKSIFRTPLDAEDRRGYLRLDKNEMSSPFPADLLQDLRGIFDEYSIQAYPSMKGIIDHAANLLEHPLSSQVLLTPGSDFALKICYESLVQSQDTVCLPSPTYAMNKVYAAVSDLKCSEIYYAKNLKIDIPTLLKSLDHCKMFVLANPNQPTGRLEDQSLMIQLLDLCELRGIWVIIDEAYYSYSEYTSASLVSRYRCLIVTRSFSKSYGIAGLRLGALISNESNIEYLSKAMPAFPVNAFALYSLPILVKHKAFFDQLHQEIISQRQRMSDFYNGIGCSAYPSDTNFLMLETCGRFSAQEYIDGLRLKKILIRGPWTQAPYVNTFRVSLSTGSIMDQLIVSTNEFLNER